MYNYFSSLFKNHSTKSTDPLFRIWQRIEKDIKTDPDVLNPDHSVHISKVEGGGYAYISELSAFIHEAHTNPKLNIMKEKLMVSQYAFVVQQGSVYNYILSKQ